MNNITNIKNLLYASLSLKYRFNLDHFSSEDLRSCEWRRLAAWINQNGLNTCMTKNDNDIIMFFPGYLNEQQQYLASWGIERAGVCAWALNMYRWMRYDEPINNEDETEIMKSTGFLNQIPISYILQKKEKLLEYQRMVRTCLWRLVEFDRGKQYHDLASMAQQMKSVDLSVKYLQLIDCDLAVNDQKLDLLSRDDYDSLYCSVQERLKTITWILDSEENNYHEILIDA